MNYITTFEGKKVRIIAIKEDGTRIEGKALYTPTAALKRINELLESNWQPASNNAPVPAAHTVAGGTPVRTQKARTQPRAYSIKNAGKSGYEVWFGGTLIQRGMTYAEASALAKAKAKEMQ